ncbi:MAG: CTP synthase, partial [Spirochaetes bacterium]|nr:CTP synthase [Spirochaetota bacterium]
TDDGAETDLDLGNYARFTSAPITRASSITTGQVYRDVINKEREGRFLGRTVQVVPHITDEIKSRIVAVGKEAEVDVTIIEVGGTVGDMESIPFLEAARQLIHEYGHSNAISVHVTLIPAVTGGELKTKPSQHSVKELQEVGIQPDVLVCRSDELLDEGLRRKLSAFTNIDFEGVISAYNVRSIYEVPLAYHDQGLDAFILKRMNVESRHANLKNWRTMVAKIKEPKNKLRIGVVGKYMELHDAYKSVWEALYHGGIANQADVEIVPIDSDKLEGPASEHAGILANIDGILVPGGFGHRGILGMVAASAFARSHGLPYFGICLGMQIMTIDWARNVLGWQDADSTEFNQNSAHPVVSLLQDQINIKNFGGTMRLGRNDTIFREGCKAAKAYGSTVISERHRHRYEFSNVYREDFIKSGLIVAGYTPDEELVECLEWPDHPWGVGVQFHPEFKSSPVTPHPLFSAFVKASLEYGKTKKA